MADIVNLRRTAYDLQLQINLLQNQINETTDPILLEKLLDEINQLEEQLQPLEQAIGEDVKNSEAGVIAKAKVAGPVVRGLDKSGSPISSNLRMTYLPTPIYHLLNVDEHPLVEYVIKRSGNQIVQSQSLQYRLTTVIENYSAMAITTIEVENNEEETIKHLPTLFPEAIQSIRELTRATLEIKVEQLGSNSKLLIHETKPIWLLSRNSAPLEVRDPTSGTITDLSRYLGAFVTPNAPTVIKFLRVVATHHPEGRIYGYQQDVKPQVKAIFDALKEESKIAYVNSTVAFNPEQNATSQRVRLPRECLDEGSANCIDGTLLFASLLEAASLTSAIVLTPGHAFVGWLDQPDTDSWSYLETTMIGTNSFEEALDIGNRKAKTYSTIAAKNPNQTPPPFRRWSLRELRTKYQITPLE